MKTTLKLFLGLLIILVSMLIPLPLSAQVSTIPLSRLPQNAKLALCGDSITEQRLYTKYVEAYLLACEGRKDISVFQFGWGGENADQFRNRIKRGDLDAFKPTAITFLYGANDCGGQPWDGGWMNAMWKGRINNALKNLNARYPASAKYTVICSPTYFDQRQDGTLAKHIATNNNVLSHFRDIDISIAKKSNTGFADIRQRMFETNKAAKKALGPKYRIAGTDGVHPGPNGHLIIAYEVLKSLNCQGAIATINVDLSGKTSTSEGHQVVSSAKGKVTIDSTRYPFCYNYDSSSAADRMSTILPYLPFNKDLNRFVLVVKNLKTPFAEVAWGGIKRTFSRDELMAGINLMETFSKTPFDAKFAKLLSLIEKKQTKERDMIKAAKDATAPEKGWTEADVIARNKMDEAVKKALKKVRHTISIVPVRAK